MNHIKLLFLLFTLTIFQSSFAQATLLQESFESNGEGSRYTSNAGDSGINDFWGRTNLNPAPYHSDVIGSGTRDGSWYWAGEATSDPAFNFADGGQLTFNSVSVSGYSALEVTLAVGISKAGQDHWEKERLFVLEYKMDSGPWTVFGLMRGDNPGNSVPGRLKIDTDNDAGTFGPFGTEITGTFTDYTFPIGVTGTNMQLRIYCNTSGSEEIGFDNVRLVGTGTDCPDGFVFEPGSGQCIDIDECAAGPDTCPPGTICINTNGGFLCESCEVTAVCQNVTIQLNDSGIATLTPENINNNSSTVCGDIQLAVDLTAFTCSNIGSNNTAELTVTNNGGGESTCTATVTVEDNIAPTITCPATQTEFVDASCQASLADYTSLATAGDNCGTVSVVQSPPAGMSFTSDIEVTLTAQDGGLSKSCTFTVQPKDNTPPTASNPATINVSCLDDVPAPNPGVVTDESDNCSVPVVCTGEIWINEIHYDNTGDDTGEFVEIAGPAGTDLSGYSLAFHTGSNGTVYSIVNLSGVIDDESNGIGAVAFFEAGIQNGPQDGVALIKNGTVIEFLSYEGSFTATNGDASGITSTNIGVQESSSTAVGERLQLKGSGNQSSDFTWTAPSTDSPGDLNDGQTITPCSGPSGCTSEVWINEIHYDDFSTDEGEFVEVAGPAGTNLSAYTLLFYNGSNDAVYRTVNLSGVIDDEGDGIGAVAFSEAGIQNGSPDGVALIKNGAVIEFLSYEGSLTATNGAASGTTSTDIGVQEGSSTSAGESLQLKGSGNQSSDFTWTAPSTDSPGDLNDGQTITSCGNSTPNEISVTFLSEINNGGLGSLDDPIVITRTYQVKDAAGNTTPVLRTINVFDDVSPTAVCPSNIPDVELDVNGNGSLSANIGDGSSTDNCSATETSPALNFTCSDVGLQTVLLTATDPAGNQNSISCSFTVVDNSNACCTPGIATSISGSPGPLCPSSLQTLSVNGSLNDDQSWVWYTGSCGGTQVATGANFNVSPTTTTTYYVRAEGTCSGTSGTCASLTITIEDGVNPVASCPADISVNNDPGQCSAVVSFAATGSDNCGGPVGISYSQDPGTAFNVGTTTVDVTAKDESGNTDNCSFDVVVADSEGPTVLCNSRAVSLGGDGTYTLTDAFIFNNIVASITDNCGTTDQVSASKTEFTCDDLGDIEVQLTFTDINGKTSSCFPKIGVIDPLRACNQPPTAVCQNLTVQTVTGTCEATITADQINNGSSDPDNDDLILSLDNTGPFSAGGPYTVELTVSDGSLDDKCTATVMVEDKEAPKFTGCPDPINLFNDDGDCGAIATWTAPVLEDNCPDPASSSTHMPGDFFPVGTTTVTYSGSDKAGNPAVACSFTVSVTDTEDPRINCPADISTGTDPGVCGAQITFTPAIASDNCEVAQVKARYRPVDENGSALGSWSSRVVNPSGFFPVGRYQVQWRAKDIYGNKESCSHYVEVYDDEDPQAVCKNLTIDFNGEQDINLSVSQVWDEAASSDNCGSVAFVSADLTIGCEELGNTVAIPVTIQDELGNTDVCTAYVDVIGFPCGWSEGPNDGSLNCDGQTTAEYEVDDESFTLTSDGCWPAFRQPDKATYIYHPLCGDGTLTAELASINTSGYAGLMARESLDPLARRAGVLKNFSTRSVRREYRASYGGIVSQSRSSRSRVKWLRITRQGNQIKSYTSTNGVSWRLLYRITYTNLEDCIYVGMMAYSLNGSAEVKAVFKNVTLSGSGTLAGGILRNPTSTIPEELNAWSTLEDVENGSIEVFPNPASDQTQLVLDNFQDKPAQLIVRDAFGKTVRQIDLDSAMGVNMPLEVQD
ncbi:MAG: HYR domain-containing protein, partial [Saprospiraceae bacterium]|nr:HYR domain-containing protein [Saprospiraceae bacterium]